MLMIPSITYGNVGYDMEVTIEGFPSSMNIHGIIAAVCSGGKDDPVYIFDSHGWEMSSAYVGVGIDTLGLNPEFSQKNLFELADRSYAKES